MAAAQKRVKGQPSLQDEGTAEGRAALAQHLSDVARSFQAEDDPRAMLARLVRAAVDLIPGATAVEPSAAVRSCATAT